MTRQPDERPESGEVGKHDKPASNKERLSQSESLINAVFESAGDAIGILRDGIFVDANQAAGEMFNCRLDEFIGRSPIELSPEEQPDGRPSKEKAQEKTEAALGGETQRFRWCNRRFDGSIFDAEVCLSRLELDDGPALLAMVRDLTEQMENEAKYKALVENSPDVIMRLDREGRHLFVNQSVEDVVPIPAEEFVGKTHRELGFQDHICSFWEQSIRTAFDSGETYETEFETETPTGSKIFDWRLIPETTSDGQVSYLISIARDITSARNAERQYQQLFEEMLDGYAVCNVILDDDGKPKDYRFRTVNPACERLAGIKANDVIGKTLGEVFPGVEEYWAEVFYRVTTTGEPVRSSRFSQLLGMHLETVTFRPAENQVAVVFQDVTERRREEEARKAADRALDGQRVLQINSDRLRSLGEMATGVAHELNQPLVGVRGLAEHVLIAMDRGWDMDEERLRVKLEAIVEQADRMTQIIEHIRNFAREAGEATVHTLSLNDVVNSATELMRAQLRSHGIELELVLDDDLPEIVANPYSLEEVIFGLMINARDAVEEQMEQSAPESPSITIKTSADSSDGKPQVLLSVIDNGIGVPENLLPEVFEPFFTTKKPGLGTGLGLPTAKAIVEGLGGAIDLHSKPGAGTTVTVSLPSAANEKY